MMDFSIIVNTFPPAIRQAPEQVLHKEEMCFLLNPNCLQFKTSNFSKFLIWFNQDKNSQLQLFNPSLSHWETY